MDNKQYSEVLEHLTTLRKGSLWDLSFSSSLEQQYQHGQNDWYRDSIRVSSLLAVVLLLSGHLIEWGTGVQVSPIAMLVRALAMIGLLLTYLYIRRSKRLTWKYWWVCANTLLITGALLVLAHDLIQPFKMIYYSDVFFVEVVVFAFIRLPFNFTNTLGLLLLLMVATGLYLDNMSLQLSIHVFFFLIAGSLIAMMISIKTEKMSRENFLKTLMISYEKNHLRALNDKLNEQLSLDRITHLFNRIAFEDRLLSSWSIGGSKNHHMLVAIQVENFAHFNENYGEEVGDDLLREVARKIRNVLVDEQDFAARISGGRFILLLSGAMNSQEYYLEKLRSKLLNLTTLQRETEQGGGIYLSWGRVLMDADFDRDPRGIIDRMYGHLQAIEKNTNNTQKVSNFT